MFCLSLTLTTFLLLFNYSNCETNSTTVSIKPAPPFGACEERRYVRVGNTVYVERNKKVTFPEAEQKCIASSGRLVNFRVHRKLDIILKWIRNCTAPTVTGPYFVNVVKLDARSFQWINDTGPHNHVSNIEFCAGSAYENLNPNSKYIALTVKPDGYCYQDLLENDTAYFICEKHD